MASRSAVIFLISLFTRSLISAPPPPPTATTEATLVTLTEAEPRDTVSNRDAPDASNSNVTRQELSYRLESSRGVAGRTLPASPLLVPHPSPARLVLPTRTQHNNNKPHTRKRHRKRKLQHAAPAPWRGATRRTYTSAAPSSTMRQDSPVAIILAKLNSDRAGSPSVRPYRLEKGSRDLKPMDDDSNETLQEILNAIKLQVTERDITDTLIGDAFNNITSPNYDTGLEQKLIPSKRSKANDSAKTDRSYLKALQLMSLENLAESYTEPSFDYVVQSRADTLQQTETPSTLPSEYFDDLNHYEALTNYNLDNDEFIPFNDEAKTSIESVMEFQPISVEPADTDNGVNENQLLADMLDTEPRLCSQTDDVNNEPCLFDEVAPKNMAEPDCEVTLESCPTEHTCNDPLCDGTHTCIGAHCDGTHTCTGAHCDDTLTNTDENDVTGCSTGGCLATGRDAGDDLGEDEIKGSKKKDVVLAVNKKSYKISIIFQ